MIEPIDKARKLKWQVILLSGVEPVREFEVPLRIETAKDRRDGGRDDWQAVRVVLVIARPRDEPSTDRLKESGHFTGACDTTMDLLERSFRASASRLVICKKRRDPR